MTHLPDSKMFIIADIERFVDATNKFGNFLMLSF